jgi:hypothetical protein
MGDPNLYIPPNILKCPLISPFRETSSPKASFFDIIHPNKVNTAVPVATARIFYASNVNEIH